MRHRSIPWSLLVLAAVAAGARAPLSCADEGGTSKSVPEKNFSWSVPAGWVIEDADGDNKEAGYVCIARKEVDPNKGASAWVMVVDAGGASLDSLVTKSVDNKKQKLADVDSTPAAKTEWAGVVDARYVQIGGKSKENGAAIAHRLYSAVVEGKLHQLDIKTWNGAEADLMTDLDAVAGGYKVLKGATAGTAGGAAGGPSDGGGEAPDGDTHKARFDKLGLTWTLPQRPQIRNFSMTQRSSPNAVPTDKGNLTLAQARLDGEGPGVEIEVSVEKAQPGGTSKGFINNDENFKNLIENNFEGTPVPNLDEEVKLGNWHGAMKSFTGTGKGGGKKLYVRTIFSVLREYLYIVRVVAFDNAQTQSGLQIGDALGGLKWDDITEGVRGPVAMEFRSVTTVRADLADVGKETPIFKLATFSMKKPAAFGKINYNAQDQGFEHWAAAIEARKPGAYMFFGIQTFTADQLKAGTPPRTPDSLINDLESTWKNDVEDTKTMSFRGGKANKVTETIRGAKALKYEFSGTYERNPFLEKGWVATSGTNVLWIRMQFGGKDAEKAFETEAKAVLNSLKIE